MSDGYASAIPEQWLDMAPGEETVNVRILWQDQIFTKNHRVMQYMLATGFEDFRKGPATKLRYGFKSLFVAPTRVLCLSVQIIRHVRKRNFQQ